MLFRSEKWMPLRHRKDIRNMAGMMREAVLNACGGASFQNYRLRQREVEEQKQAQDYEPTSSPFSPFFEEKAKAAS